MQKKESSLLLMAKVIVMVSSVIGIFTIWGISYYMLVIESTNKSQIPSSQIVLTQSACAKLETNQVAQGDCYLKVAKTRRDATICSKISILEIRSLCFVELAEVRNDYAICEDNEVTPSLLAACKDYFRAEKTLQDDIDAAQEGE